MENTKNTQTTSHYRVVTVGDRWFYIEFIEPETGNHIGWSRMQNGGKLSFTTKQAAIDLMTECGKIELPKGE